PRRSSDLRWCCGSCEEARPTPDPWPAAVARGRDSLRHPPPCRPRAPAGGQGHIGRIPMPTTDLTSVRASSLPLAFRCAASLRPEGPRIDSVHEAAADGIAAHECLRALMDRGAIDWDGIPEVAERHGADPEQVRILCSLGVRLWKSVSAVFAGALTEVAMSAEVMPGVLLTGHADLVATNGTVAHVGDWKTGRKDSDYSHQMRAYGALVMLDNLELTEVTVSVLWVRDEEIESYRMTRAGAEAWLRELADRVIRWDGVYRTGSHCAQDRKSTRLNSSHVKISYAVFCLKKIR